MNDTFIFSCSLSNLKDFVKNDLKSILNTNSYYSSAQFRIKRSSNPKCIYNLFTDIDDEYIEMRIYNDNISFFIHPNKHYRPEHFFSEELELLTEGYSLSVTYDKNNHNRDLITRLIPIDGSFSTYNVSCSLYYCNYILIEDDNGRFDVSVHGMKIDLKWIIDMFYYFKLDEAYGLTSILNYINIISDDRDQIDRFLHHISKIDLEIKKVEGITKAFNKVSGFYKDLIERKKTTSALSFKLLVDESKRTVTGMKVSNVFNVIFSDVSDEESFLQKISILDKILLNTLNIKTSFYQKLDDSDYITNVINNHPDVRERKKSILLNKNTAAINKIMEDIEFLYLDKKQFPLTYENISNGSIPISTFFRRSNESYFTFNNNWPLWEEMLAKHPDFASSIATEVSKRTTYEKDAMSFFYFVLYSLPEYLEKHTGKKWTCIPKMVVSEHELEPPTESSGGTTKRRSALTPIPDNENNTVVVPYVSMRMHGHSTTYCYALDYNILHKGMSFNGNCVMRDVEEKLNGFDDYGLMFYTLTGSASGRGYPTFLIIFERLVSSTRVHFHRTHPMRSKSGEYNPIHDWTIGCYKWMVGNVSYDRIAVQQGDLVFVRCASPLDTDLVFEKVDSYDNHRFKWPVEFTPYMKKEKSNILGYFRVDEDVRLMHNEHIDRIIPAGEYELRQCRSWEANPKGIWSLRID